jgi:dihydrofolate synthase / folylpolyglutamate synthase
MLHRVGGAAGEIIFGLMSGGGLIILIIESSVAASYTSSLEYLFSLHRFGMKLGVEVIAALLARLGNPHRRFPAVHIGGTNGKGSSAAIVASILRAAGYRVGLYTSPHLVDFRERIQVQGHPISPEQVCVLTKYLRSHIKPNEAPTFFEVTTAMAFRHFADEQVDIAVVEVGLGGRLDATNVLTPLGVLITSIAFDHEQYLGNTLEAIASEKAGILSPGRPVVLGPMPDVAAQVIQSHADRLQAPVARADKAFRAMGDSHDFFGYQGREWSLSGLSCNLPGRHQIVNSINALALLEFGVQKAFPVTEQTIRDGLRQVRWPGRLEVLARDPLVILDGAHNPSAAEVLFDFLESALHDAPDRKLILVIGMMADKNHKEFLGRLVPIADTVIFTRPHMERAATPEMLVAAMGQASVHRLVISDPHDALARAEHMARPSDLICVTGSLFLVGEISRSRSPSGTSTVQV